MLKLLVLLLPCKYSDLSKKTLWFTHTVPQQTHKKVSFCWVYYVNHLVSQIELSFHVFGQYWYHNCRPFFHSIKIFCCNDQLISQSNKLVEVCFSHCKTLYQSELFVVIVPENLQFFILVFGITFRQKNEQICLGI